MMRSNLYKNNNKLDLLQFILKYFNSIFKVVLIIVIVFFIYLQRVDAKFRSDTSLFIIGKTDGFIKVLSSPLTYTHDLLRNLYNISSLMKDVNRLSAENKLLKENNFKLDILIHENADLRSILNVGHQQSHAYVFAKVLSSTDIFTRSIFVKHDSNVTISKYQPVIDEYGIIGRIVDINKNYARVLLINDTLSRIPVMIVESRMRGILCGTQFGDMFIKYLTKIDGIKVGDRVVTSDDLNGFPENMSVGEVSQIDTHNNIVFVKRNRGFSNINNALILQTAY